LLQLDLRSAGASTWSLPALRGWDRLLRGRLHLGFLALLHGVREQLVVLEIFLLFLLPGLTTSLAPFGGFGGGRLACTNGRWRVLESSFLATIAKFGQVLSDCFGGSAFFDMLNGFLQRELDVALVGLVDKSEEEKLVDIGYVV